MINFISEEIKSIMKKQIVGKPNNKNACQVVKKEVEKYLFEITKKMDYKYLPDVVVENECGIMTINFFDKNGMRLETLGDLLSYMQINQNYGIIN